MSQCVAACWWWNVDNFSNTNCLWQGLDNTAACFTGPETDAALLESQEILTDEGQWVNI